MQRHMCQKTELAWPDDVSSSFNFPQEKLKLTTVVFVLAAVTVLVVVALPPPGDALAALAALELLRRTLLLA